MLRLRRLRCVGFAILVALLHALLPVLAQAAFARDAGATQEICSASGLKRIAVDGGAPAHETSPAQHCQLCVTGGPALVSTPHLRLAALRTPEGVSLPPLSFRAADAPCVRESTGPPLAP